MVYHIWYRTAIQQIPSISSGRTVHLDLRGCGLSTAVGILILHTVFFFPPKRAERRPPDCRHVGVAVTYSRTAAGELSDNSRDLPLDQRTQMTRNLQAAPMKLRREIRVTICPRVHFRFRLW